MGPAVRAGSEGFLSRQVGDDRLRNLITMDGKWAKAPPALVERFSGLVPEAPGVQRKSMFGYPCAFVDSQMFMGLFEDTMMLRLSPTDREELAALGGKPFAPMGRTMKEYMVVPLGLDLDPWIQRSLAFARSLPPKAKKKK